MKLLFYATLATVSLCQTDYSGCLFEPPEGTPGYYDHTGLIKPYTGPEQISFPKSYQDKLEDYLKAYIDMTVKGAPPEKEFPFYSFPPYYVYYGSAGRALTFFKLYLNDRAGPSATYYLGQAKAYIDGSLGRIQLGRSEEVGFIEGNPGVWAVASVVYDSLGLTGKANEFLGNINKVLKRRPFTRQVDFDRGLAGLLYTVEFVE